MSADNVPGMRVEPDGRAVCDVPGCAGPRDITRWFDQYKRLACGLGYATCAEGTAAMGIITLAPGERVEPLLDDALAASIRAIVREEMSRIQIAVKTVEPGLRVPIGGGLVVEFPEGVDALDLTTAHDAERQLEVRFPDDGSPDRPDAASARRAAVSALRAFAQSLEGRSE